MNSNQLAQVFDDAGRDLESRGHLIVVRRARQFLTDGRVDLASAFLLEAKRRMPIDQVSRLCDAFGAWRRNEGDLEMLLGDSAWIDASTREDALSAHLAARTRDIGYSTLMNTVERPESSIAPPPVPERVDEPNALEWDEEPTSEIFEAQTQLFDLPEVKDRPSAESKPAIPDGLIVGVITMLFVLTIYFCFFRSF